VAKNISNNHLEFGICGIRTRVLGFKSKTLNQPTDPSGEFCFIYPSFFQYTIAIFLEILSNLWRLVHRHRDLFRTKKYLHERQIPEFLITLEYQHQILEYAELVLEGLKKRFINFF
jgi:hypothetical protein